MDSGKKKLDQEKPGRTTRVVVKKKKENSPTTMGGNHPGLITLSFLWVLEKGVHLECGSSVPAMRRHHPGI